MPIISSTVLGPLSEVYGRVPLTYFAATVVAVFNLVIPWAPDASVFIVFRLFAGFGASAPLAIGAGIISDMFISEHRGQAVALCAYKEFRCGGALLPQCKH